MLITTSKELKVKKKKNKFFSPALIILKRLKEERVSNGHEFVTNDGSKSWGSTLVTMTIYRALAMLV